VGSDVSGVATGAEVTGALVTCTTGAAVTGATAGRDVSSEFVSAVGVIVSSFALGAEVVSAVSCCGGECRGRDRCG